MRYLKAVLLGFAMAALVGCVMADVKMLDERTAVISAQGGVEHTMADVQQKVFLEAANLCIQRGYRYFKVLAASDASSAGTMLMPGQTYGQATATTFGNSTAVSGSAYSTPGYALPFVKPGADVTIQMYREGEIQPGPGIWDSQSILAAQIPVIKS